MARKRSRAEAISSKRREAEVALAEGATVPEGVRRLGISEPTSSRWRREFRGDAGSQSRPASGPEQRIIKQRYRPMLGFESFASAARFCSAFDELRHSVCARQRGGQSAPLAAQRRLCVTRGRPLIAEMQAAKGRAVEAAPAPSSSRRPAI